MDDEEITVFREQLLGLQLELKEALELTPDSLSTVELDQQRVGRLSRMGAIQSQAMAKEMERRTEIALRRVSAALARTQTGDYGYCLECGEEINRGRLEVDPAAPLCLDCASAKESV